MPRDQHKVSPQYLSQDNHIKKRQCHEIFGHVLFYKSNRPRLLINNKKQFRKNFVFANILEF